MTCFDTDPSLRWLVCVAHPDDELAIAAWLRRLCRQSNDVFLSWTHHTDVRREEAVDAAKRIGIPEDRLFFHAGRDGSIVDQIPDLTLDFREMAADIRPDRVVVGAFEQGHLDHDATNFLVAQAYSGPKLEVPLYHTYVKWAQKLNRFADPAGQEVIELDEQEQAFKVEMAQMYPSQTILSALVWYEFGQLLRMNPVELKRTERIRAQTHFDFLRPNLPPELAARVRQSAKWKRWEAALREYADGGLWKPEA